MTFHEDPTGRGIDAFLVRRIRDAIVLAAGAALALPLIVPFA